jgi:hypothetical protein
VCCVKQPAISCLGLGCGFVISQKMDGWPIFIQDHKRRVSSWTFAPEIAEHWELCISLYVCTHRVYQARNYIKLTRFLCAVHTNYQIMLPWIRSKGFIQLSWGKYLNQFHLNPHSEYCLIHNTYGTEGPGREKSSIIVLYFFKVRSRCATDHFSKLLAVKFIWPILFLGIIW